MKTLDRYVARSFLFAALLWLLIFMSLRILVDLFVNLDDFTAPGATAMDMIGRIANYYSYQSLTYFAEMGSVIVVISAITTFAMMNRTNEVTAILASGVSLHRIVWPLIAMAVLMSGLVLVDQELVIPQVADKLVWRRDNNPDRTSFPIRMTPDATHAVWYARTFWPHNNTMSLPHVFLWDDDSHPLGYIQGRLGYPGFAQGRKGWLINDATLVRAGTSWQDLPDTNRIFTSRPLAKLLEEMAARRELPLTWQTAAFSLPLAEPLVDPAYGLKIEAEALEIDPPIKGVPRGGKLVKPVFSFIVEYESRQGSQAQTVRQTLGQFMADSATWKPRQAKDVDNDHWLLSGGRLFYASDLDPEQIMLHRSSHWMQYMSSSELNRLLKMERVSDPRGAMLIKHARFTEPMVTLLMLLLGVPFVLSRERKIKASLALCLLTVGGFFTFVYICRMVELPATLAAWLPILLFSPVASVMVAEIKT